MTTIWHDVPSLVLLEMLAGVQPEMAEEIRDAWAQRRERGKAMVAHAELWEQRTTEQLVRLLAPLLEARWGNASVP
jgi:hypothetical protein